MATIYLKTELDLFGDDVFNERYVSEVASERGGEDLAMKPPCGTIVTERNIFATWNNKSDQIKSNKQTNKQTNKQQQQQQQQKNEC